MAKNLKINIKNAQLAEALKLGQIKKPSAAKKKKADEAVESPPAETKPVEAAPAAPVAAERASPPEPPLAPVEKQQAEEPVTKAEPPASEPKAEEQKRAPAPAETPHPGYHRPRPTGSSYPYQKRDAGPSGDRPSYPPREGGGYPSREGGRPSYPPREGDRPSYPPRDGNRPSYPPRDGSRPPYQQGSRPPYPPRDGSRPPYPPRDGNRPPYQAGGARPPYQQGSRPPYPPRDGSRPPYPPRDGARPPYQQGPRPAVPPKDAPLKEGAREEPHKKVVKGPDEKAGFKEFRDFKSTRKGVGPERSFDVRDRQGLRDAQDEQSWRKRRPSHKARPIAQEEVIRPKEVKVRIPITIKDLAAEMKLKASQLVSKLFMKGVILTLNDFLDDETTIQLLGHDFDCEIKIDTSEETRLRITDKTIKQEIQEANPSELILRPPVAAFMGHVDHGKTSLIDAIRKSDIAAGEAGAITQHIGAFKCHTAVGDITILDTPGHEAFSAMRTRGADVTDIVVLVVAGDEGLRTQSLEAVAQAQAANCPIIVALNKSDKPNFNADNVFRQLADQNLLPESWGGTTITVNCSAVTGDGIKELLEMLALQAEILELRANPNTRARGTVIESEMHKGMGAVATVLVQNGTLRLGDAVVFAQNYARIKTMQDEHGRDMISAGPSTPVKVTGLSGLPEAGSEFIVVANENEAREVAQKRQEGKRHAQLQMKRGGLETFQAQPKKVLNLIVRGDVQGSVEALKTSLGKIESKKIELNIISSGVGEISESDVQLAAASKATILGFHTQIERHAESLIKQLKVTVRLHDIIYHAVDDIRAIMLSLLDKIAHEVDTGSAEVKAVFKSSQLGVIAGCMVLDGTIKRSHHMRILRNNEVVWKGAIASLKRVKEDVREVSKGYECGILLQNYNDEKVGDILQAYEITYLQQEL
ncbi:MAG: translation initiation factor IF-2 [Rhabdochlamydiaceae bacterium]|nr:translation initiation factor IF-2 [Rhabdochlamydiaceae bacterium]